jgi:Fe-S cluster assembly protein SufD
VLSPSAPVGVSRASLDTLLALGLGDAVGDAEERYVAFARYETLPAPAPPSSAWKHDLRKIDLSRLAFSPRESSQKFVMLQPHPLGNAPRASTAMQMSDFVHINPSEDAGDAVRERGVVVCDFFTARRDHAAAFSDAFGAALLATDKYAHLTRAFHTNGIFVDVPAGVTIDEPFIVFLPALDVATFPYTLIRVGAGARATFVEFSKGATSQLTCGVTEIVAAERAHVTYAVVQQYEAGTRTIMTRRASIGADATVAWALGEIGAALCVEDVLSREVGSGATSEMTALFFATGDQHVDLRTEVAHEVGATRSNTVVRSVATDRGQARHFGNIRIAARAHGSDAALHDDTLLLSKTAHVDAIPALEIAANDVKAFHGATVGAVDEEHLFYIMSRGIDRRAAEQLVTLGFFEPAITRFPLDAVREHLRTALAAKVTAAVS